jgi:hypothetical protein
MTRSNNARKIEFFPFLALSFGAHCKIQAQVECGSLSQFCETRIWLKNVMNRI